MSCLSPLISRQADANDPPDSAPHASPEVSDIDLQNTPRKLLAGNVNAGSLLRVPSPNNTWNENINEVTENGLRKFVTSSLKNEPISDWFFVSGKLVGIVFFEFAIGERAKKKKQRHVLRRSHDFEFGERGKKRLLERKNDADG